MGARERRPIRPARELPARPDLDHLKNEAKALRKAFVRGEAEAVSRVDAVGAFVAAVMEGSRERALEAVRREPDIATTSLHVAATLGREVDVRRLASDDPTQLHLRVDPPAGDPLFVLCWSPFHGESAERDAGLEASLRAMLDAGADANTRGTRYDCPRSTR